MFPAIRPGDERKSFAAPGTKLRFARPNWMKARFHTARSPLYSPGWIIIHPPRVEAFPCVRRRPAGQKIRVVSWGCQSWSKPVRTL
jgi:hypothetical protein